MGSENSHYGLLYSIATGSLQSLTYGYDEKGNLLSLADFVSGRINEILNFGYDDLDRLISVSAPIGEGYSYNPIGTFVSKGGVDYHYPSAPTLRPHAPDWVGSAGNLYSYDGNGNLLTAEGRTYSYDVENRLIGASGASLPTLGFEYDGDGVLRKTTEDGTLKTRYVTGEYQVKGSGEPVVYYRIGGRTVAWHNNAALRYLLADHLGSTHGEANQSGAETGQRRYRPWGSDRPVSGATDLTRDERYTGQRRVEAGGGAVNDRKELYHYNARAYLPGVGIFGQPDTATPDYKNPQGLNRFAYVLNSPLRYNDPTGHREVEDADPNAYVPPARPVPVRAPTPGPIPAATPTPAPPGGSQPAATPSGPSLTTAMLRYAVQSRGLFSVAFARIERGSRS